MVVVKKNIKHSAKITLTFFLIYFLLLFISGVLEGLGIERKYFLQALAFFITTKVLDYTVFLNHESIKGR